MKKFFFLLACVAMSMWAMGQDNQLIWLNGYIFKIFIIFAVDLHLKYGIRPINC